MKIKPGEAFDSKGYPIYPGDLLKTLHFVDDGGRKNFLYHVAIWNADLKTMEMVPTSHLEPAKRTEGGRCWLTTEMASSAEILSGYGPGFCCFKDRPRNNTKKE